MVDSMLFKNTLFILTFLWASVTNAQEELIKLHPDHCNELTVVGSDQWIPFAYSEYGQPKGIAFDTVQLLALDLGLELRFKFNIPWKRLELLMDNGDADLLAGNYWTEQRDKKWAISQAFSQDEIRIFRRTDKTIQYSRLADLKTHRGLIPRGVSLGATFDSFKPQLNLDEVQTHNQMITMLNIGRADYIVLPLFNGQRKINQMGLGQELVSVTPAISVNRVHLSLSKKALCFSQDRLTQFNEAISKRLKDGSIKKIEETYMAMPKPCNANECRTAPLTPQ